MKPSVLGELVLLVGVLALAYLLWLQQGQLVELEYELDRMRAGGTMPPVPVAGDNGAEATMPQPPAPKRKRAPRGA
jgi:hypothetical protein